MVVWVVLTCIQLSWKLWKDRISATKPDRVMVETLNWPQYPSLYSCSIDIWGLNASVLMLLTKNHIFWRPSWISCHRKKCSTLTSWHTLELDSACINWQETTKKYYICWKTSLKGCVASSLDYSAGWSAGTPFTLHCHLSPLPCARVHWNRKLAAKQSGSKSCGLFSVMVATDSVSSQNFRHWPAETRANRLLGSGLS